MSSRPQQFRPSFLLTGALVALGLVTAFALLSSRSATRVVQQQANARGQDVASHVASLVSLYLRERHQEAEALARSPAVVRAAVDASQQAVRQRLTQLDIPTLERMFNQRRELGGDPDLATYLHDYSQRSDFAELFFTESHGYNVLSSGRTSDFVQSDEAWWQRAVADGAYDGPPSYDSSAAVVSLEYDIAIRAPRVARPIGVLKAVFALDRLSQILGTAELTGAAHVQVVDSAGILIVGPDKAGLLHPLADAALVPRLDRPATAVVHAPAGDEQVVGGIPGARGSGVRGGPQYRGEHRALDGRPVRGDARPPVPVLAAAQHTRDATRQSGGRHRQPDRRRRSLRDGRDGARRDGRGGRPALVGALDGRRPAAPGGRHPDRGRRGGGDGDGNLGLDGANERVDGGDVRHRPGSEQARRGSGAAGASGRGRRGEDRSDRHDPRGRGRRLGATYTAVTD